MGGYAVARGFGRGGVVPWQGGRGWDHVTYNYVFPIDLFDIQKSDIAQFPTETTFSGIKAAYFDRYRRPILKNISFTVMPGKKIALVRIFLWAMFTLSKLINGLIFKINN